MAQILVRQLDDRIVQALKDHASAERLSLEEFVRRLLSQAAARPSSRDQAERMERLRRLWSSQPSHSRDSVPDLRALREKE